MKLLASEFRRQTVLKVLGRAQTEKKTFSFHFSFFESSSSRFLKESYKKNCKISVEDK